jgi:hypothetical protein
MCRAEHGSTRLSAQRQLGVQATVLGTPDAHSTVAKDGEKPPIGAQDLSSAAELWQCEAQLASRQLEEPHLAIMGWHILNREAARDQAASVRSDCQLTRLA